MYSLEQLAGAKAEILKIGKDMDRKGMIAGNDGNISVRLDENHVVVTPTYISKGEMTAEMLSVMNLAGEVVEMGSLRPSSESKLHVAIYKANPKINAVTHAHPPYATAYAAVGKGLEDCNLTEAMVSLGPIHVAPYADAGTQEVADSVVPFVGLNGVLLERHGALTWGEDLKQAFYRLDQLEHVAKIMWLANFIK